MGVPNFFSWLIKRYPLCIYDFDEAHTHQTDFLFIDMNQIIYHCATDPSVLFKDQIRQREFEDIWISIFQKLNLIVDTARPKKLLFMAFDGVAPRAKMNQQRSRRFLSARNHTKLEESLNKLGFEQRNQSHQNNQISAGTPFMDELNNQIKFFIKRKFYDDPKWQNLKVLYSGCDVPGEGEHKILEFIRNTQKEVSNSSNFTYTLYGADADLIILGLTTRIQNFTILREKMPPYQKRKTTIAAKRVHAEIFFQVINIGIVRDCMDLEYREIASKMKVNYNIDRIIDDFILVCSFVGNDFLPRIFCFDIKQGTLEVLILSFKEQLKTCDDYLNNGGEINWGELLRFTKRLEEFEQQAQSFRVREMMKHIHQGDVELSELLKLELNMIQSLQTSYEKNEISKVKKEFYQAKCNLSFENDLEVIYAMSDSYLKGLQFVLYYYYKGLPSWEWYYNYFYAPLCSDIFLYLQENKKLKDPNFVIDKPYQCFKQLLCILSSANANLLPEQYRKLLVDNESPLRSPQDFYPNEFDIDPYGAIWEHQYIAKIPFLDRQVLDKAYDSVPVESLNEIDRKRLENGKTILYYYDKQYTQQIKSTMPTVFEDFNVNINEILFEYNNVEQCLNLLNSLKFKKTNKSKIPRIFNKEKLDSFMKQLKKKETITQQLIIQYRLEQKDKGILKKIKQNEDVWVYCGLIEQEFGKAIGYMSQDGFELTDHHSAQEIIDQQNLNFARGNSELIFQTFKQNILDRYQDFAVDLKVKKVIIVAKYRNILRTSTGELEFKKPLFMIYPTEFVSLSQRWECKTKRYMKYTKPLELGQEFQLDSKVVIFCPKKYNEYKILNGAFGKVIKTIHETGQIIVDIQRSAIHPQLSNIPKQRTIYYVVDFVANKFQITVKQLLFVLNDVKVDLEKGDNDFADSVDVGLNVINKYENQLVPELARLPEANPEAYGFNKFKKFEDDLELSEECVNLIGEYKQKFPEIFKYLSNLNERQIEKKRFIKINELFTENNNKLERLYQIYLWILQHPTTKFFICKAASKVLSQLEINDILKDKLQQEKFNNAILIDPGFVIQQQKVYIQPFFLRHPENHETNTRVVNLKAGTSLQAQFGEIGTVVGIIDHEELYFQVVWDNPQIGLTDLDGKCPNFRGSTVQFEDIFNISLGQSELLSSRRQKIDGWDHKIKLFFPKFDDKGIQLNQAAKERIALQNQLMDESKKKNKQQSQKEEDIEIKKQNIQETKKDNQKNDQKWIKKQNQKQNQQSKEIEKNKQIEEEKPNHDNQNKELQKEQITQQ